jgi:hypothetical protein
VQSGMQSLGFRRGGSARAARLFVVVAVGAVLALGGCGSSSHPATSNTSSSVGVTAPTGSSNSTAGSTGPGSTTSGSSSPASTTTTLVTPLCNILDASTVVRVLGPTAGSCQNFANEGEAGRCLWGKLGTTGNSVQLTAFTGTTLATRKIGWKAVFPTVSGVGQGAWSHGAINLGKLSNVVLYVDYGTFGLELAVSAPNATVAMAVTLAQSVK